ncbi:MAG: ParB-like nuclease domain-containing protein, partial [Zavarzinella sp.]|nr:ParB-like nuclease domain-containing protein [Zavarzinella sp.]
MPLADAVAEYVPLADLRPLPGARPSHPGRLAELAASIRAHGVLEPLLVRPARQTWVIQRGRAGGVFGWLVLDSSLADGSAYKGEPLFFADRRDA